MKYKCSVFIITLFMTVFSGVRAENGLPVYSLESDRLSSTWDEAMPLGNGMLGALIWQKDENLRFSLDRADLWDLRPMANADKSEFSFRWVQQQIRDDNYKVVQDMFDAPYEALPAPTKIPGAALEFKTAGLGNVVHARLSISNALCEVKWSNGAVLKTYVDAVLPVGWFMFENVPQDFVPMIVPPQYQNKTQTGTGSSPDGQNLERLGYEQGIVTTSVPGQIVYHQKGWKGFEYEVAVRWKRSGKCITGVWSISSSYENKEGKDAVAMVTEQLDKMSFRKSLDNHETWWKEFWSRSLVNIPDKVLEKQWYMEQYKFGCVARADAPPVSLQAIWTADNGKLPPWKGDFHHDLNTELSYWPAYSANHPDLEEGFINWLWNNRETFKKYTVKYFGTAGMNVPGVTTLDGEPMGGWIQYSLGPTVGCWLSQSFYLHWMYSKDRQFLKDRAYPWIRDVAVYLDEISVIDTNGKHKLPVSSSPEIHDNSKNAWFSQTTNFDLAMIRWTYTKAAEMAKELGLDADAAKWEAALKTWPDFALDSDGGLAFAPGCPYEESHRHFSHLVGWFPLGLIDWSNGSEDQKIITSTLENLEKHGSDWWCGYSFSWLGNLYARAFMGDKAAETLRIFSENFCLSNSFHANGDQSKKGYSKYTYRPFTLEGNFAFASGIQEMLIQSHTGIVKLFPAIPESWGDVSFKTLRTEGAFLVSAEKKEGIVRTVEITSEKGGSCILSNHFGEKKLSIKSVKGCSIKTDRDNIIIKFKEKGKIRISGK